MVAFAAARAGDTPTMPGGALSVEAAAELKDLPSDTKVVACAANVPKLPAGVTYSQVPGYHEAQPGRYLLTDGHCAFSPSATPIPVREDTVDAP